MFPKPILDLVRRLGVDHHGLQQVETMLSLMDGDVTTVLPAPPPDWVVAEAC